MTPEEINTILTQARAKVVEDVEKMTPDAAHQLLLRLVKQNDPPGFWQHILARGYVQSQVTKD
jgi:hypothetical protein